MNSLKLTAKVQKTNIKLTRNKINIYASINKKYNKI